MSIDRKVNAGGGVVALPLEPRCGKAKWTDDKTGEDAPNKVPCVAAARLASRQAAVYEQTCQATLG